VDIAGLVRGASKGEGLGNQFLAHIREVDAVLYVLRCFEDGDITHVEGSVDPLRDAAIVETELMLADMENLERRIQKAAKQAKGNDRDAKALMEVMEPVLALLQEGRPARLFRPEGDQVTIFRQLQLLTGKPVLYVCNVSESDAATGNEWTRAVEAKAKEEHAQSVFISAEIESQIAQLPPEEKTEFLADLGLAEPGLNKVIRAGYALLDLITFFTVGPKETRAWTVRRHARAPEAAGQIHTDFERGFIKAETIDCNSYLTLGGEAGARDAGKLRMEGKEYVVQDGDIMNFRFNV
jgi:GTP-binding protein YchF